MTAWMMGDWLLLLWLRERQHLCHSVWDVKIPETVGVRRPRARHMKTRALPEGVLDLIFISIFPAPKNGEDLPMQFKFQFLLPFKGQRNLYKLNLHMILHHRICAHSNRPTKFPRSANSARRPAPLFPKAQSYLGGLVGRLRQELVVVQQHCL